ncbi:MAG TPA: hypothetical protein VFQ90_14515 [Stellaceae bacterium]|jgi:hypothetical protein|nr:hypothetical protein [Stellaceae bacterium]
MRSTVIAVLCLAFVGLSGSATCLAAQKTPSAGSAPTSSTPAAKTPTTSGQFAEESAAKAHCPSDTVVWVNLSSKVYHFSGNKDYGSTKKGAYACEKDATAQGFRAAKNEKHQ